MSPPSAAPHLLVEYDELDDALRPPAAGWVSANFLYSTSAGASASWRNTEPRWGGGPAVELQQGSGGRPIPVNAYPTLEDARNIRQPLQEVLHLDAHVVGPTAVRWCSHADQAPARVSCRIFNNTLTALGVEFSKICLDREAIPRKRMLLVRDSAQIGKLSRRPDRA